MDGQSSAALGGVSINYGQAIYQDWQASGTMTGQSQRNLAAVYVQVYLVSCCPVIQGGLWNLPAVWRYEFWNQGWDLRDADGV